MCRYFSVSLFIWIIFSSLLCLVMICTGKDKLLKRYVCVCVWMSATMHTCDLDWGRTVLLMVCVLLMLKLRLWEEVRD